MRSGRLPAGIWAASLLTLALGLAFGTTALAAMPDATAPSHPAGDSIYVREIVTGPSEILSETEIEAVVARYEGRTVTHAELNDAVAELNALYASKGYVTAQAVLEPQTVQDGVVHITLVEGRVGAIFVEGNASTLSSYITRHMSLQPGDLVRLDTLERDIVFFNGTHDVRLTAQLKPGESFGTTDYILRVEEPPRWQGSVYYTNTGRDETGLGQFGLSITNHSLLGGRDPLTVAVLRAQGTTAGSVAYSFPLTRYGSRLNAEYYNNQIRIVSGEFESVNIAGESWGSGVSLSHPLVVEPHKLVTASIAYHLQDSGTFFSGTKLIGSRVRAIVYNLTSEFRGDNSVLNIQHAVSRGVFEAGDDVADFMTYDGSITSQTRWLEQYQLTLRAAVQLSGNVLLPPSEQFAVGGVGTVRGFSTGELLGDQGYFVSLEIMRPLSNALEGFVFLDHGAAFPFKGNDEPTTPDDFATSVGIGANVSVTDHFSGTVQYGVPLGSRTGNPGQLHLRVELTF